MKALCKTNNGTIKLCNVNEPKILNDDDIKIKVKYSSFCKDDIRDFESGDYFSKEGIIGHEMSGYIIELGSKAKEDGFKIGDKVTAIPIEFCGTCKFCRRGNESCCIHFKNTIGTMCEYIVRKSNQVLKIDNFSYIEGCLIEPVTEIVEATNKLKINLDDYAVIYSEGFIGLVFCQLLKKRGVRNVTLIDKSEYRRKFALEVGADQAINPNDINLQMKLLEITDFNGYDIVIETTKEGISLNDTFNTIAKGGSFLLLTYCGVNQRISINTFNLYISNINVMTSFLYNKKSFDITKSIIESLDLRKFISKEFKLDKSIDAFKMQKEDQCIKVIVKID